MADDKSREEILNRLEQKAGDYEELYGSCNCRDVQHHIFGRSFNLADANDQVEFVKSDAAKKCRAPAGKAARIAGELILDGRT